MHDKIIQLEKHPILETDKITDAEIMMRDYDKWFLSGVADYVANDDKHDETLRCFTQFLQQFGPFVEVFSEGGEQWIEFKEGFVNAYFSTLYPKFVDALQELVKCTSVETLCGYNMGTLLYRLEMLYEDKFGVYIDSEGYGLRTINAFIREIESNVKYYIGGTVDYHA